MKKIVLTAAAVIAFSLIYATQSYAANVKKTTPKNPAPVNYPQAPKIRFRNISGSIVKIDRAKDAVKVDVKNNFDNTINTIIVAPETNITKLTDASDLKTGDTVQVISKTMDDKEVALSIAYGKLLKTPQPPKVKTVQTPSNKQPAAIMGKPKK